MTDRSAKPLTKSNYFTFFFQIVGCRTNATMRGRPCPLQRGQTTSRSATRIEASGSRGFTRRSKSMTVSQLSQTMTNQ
jgi:hypothetical protein